MPDAKLAADRRTTLIDLADPTATELAVAGGKGASLARAARELPVPPAVIVTADAYRRFLAPLRERIVDAIAEHDPDGAAERIQTLIRESDDGMAELVAALATTEFASGAVAVRSSGTLEDLPGAAFAGQHDTYLGVRGVDAVAVAVRDCYASLWNAHAMRYRARLGVSDLEAAMAVVVQRMVEVGADDAAGVAFSIDPVRGSLDDVLIGAAFGLGETVVGGEEPTDEYLVRRSDGSLVSETVTAKPFALVADESGGTRRVELAPERAEAPALDAAQRVEVAELAVAAERYFGFPQDIEWAYAAGRLHLVQSRPVTRVAARWTRDESAERFPNPVTPLTWDLVEGSFHDSLRHSFEIMGLPPFGDAWFAMRDSYIYGNQTAVELYSGRVPTDVLEHPERLGEALPEIARRFGWIQDLPVTWARDLDAYLIGIGELGSEPVDGRDPRELWDLVRRIQKLGADYFQPNIAISLTQRMLYGVLQRVLGFVLPADEVQPTFDRLLAVTETKTSQVNAELWTLSRQLRGLPELTATIETDGGEGAVARLDAFPEFARAFRSFLTRHGHRELDFDAIHPTWVEAPGIVLDQLRVLSNRDEQGQVAVGRGAQAQLEYDVLGAAPEELRYLFGEIIRLAREYTALDDIEHYQTTRLTVPLRRAARALGERFVEAGALDEAMDVFFLHAATIETAIAADDLDVAALREAASTNRAAFEQALETTPDWVHGESAVVDADDDPDALRGTAGSPGTAEGEVYVVRSPADFGDFPAGAILVARTTNPAWTSLFYQAAGVITESGGALSHGAVTARELGLPAVMAVRGATTRLENGDRVRVDGQAGTVTRTVAG